MLASYRTHSSVPINNDGDSINFSNIVGSVNVSFAELYFLFWIFNLMYLSGNAVIIQ